jgi:hypothetical protein
MVEELSQSEFPDSWTDDCPSKGIRVEVVGSLSLQGSQQFSWIEIPTSDVEVWEKRGGRNSPNIKKTAKVTFPTEWDGADVRSVVTSYGLDGGVTPARVWLKDSPSNDVDSSESSETISDGRGGTWVLDFCGYVGGVGGTENALESKCWIYDWSERFEGIGVTQSYNFPNAQQVLVDMAETMRENLVPLVNVVVLPPNGELAYLQDVAALDEGVEVTSGSSYYGYDVSQNSNPLNEDVPVENIEVDSGPQVPLEEQLVDVIGGAISLPTTISQQVAQNSTRFAIEWLYRKTSLGTKEFTRNHDTVGDVLNWLASKTNLQWHFEPAQNGVILVVTGGPMRRTFVQENVVNDLTNGRIEPEAFQPSGTTGEYRAHETVSVRQNTALYQSAPANTIIVKGDTRRSLLEGNKSLDGLAESVPVAFEDTTFPYVKATIPNLVEDAGTELLLEYESDATTVDETETAALQQLQASFSQGSTGEIYMDGAPRILPYDVIDAYEVCDDYVSEQIPVRYEVTELKHHDSVTSTLETRATVQPFVSESSIEYEVSEMRDVSQ